MVKPGGTDRPSLLISARFAPLPPSRTFMSARPSAAPAPNAYSHLGIFLAFDPGKIRYGVQNVSYAGQKQQAILAQQRVVGIDCHLVEESIDRFAEPRHGGHCFAELFLSNLNLNLIAC